MNACPTNDELHALLQDSLPPEDSLRISQHLAVCAACRNAVDRSFRDGDLDRWRMMWDEMQSDHQAAAGGGEQEPVTAGMGRTPASVDGEGALADVPTLEDAERLLEGVPGIRAVRVLGRGSYGIVVLAQGDLHPQLAVKVLRPGWGDDPHEVQRFEREARAAASVNHENVVTIHHIGTAPVTKLPYIVMEYVEGETLRERLNRLGLLDANEAAELARQTAVGLHAAHARGVLHRDVKPSNILVANGSGRVKISDFGLAAVTEASRSARLPSERIVGTAPYLSPEQFVSPSAADQRSDVYALGVVLYELLTGERPFRGTEFALCLQIIHDEPPAPRRLHPEIHRDLETICLKCLEKKPAARYDTAQDLAEDLARFLQGDPIRARPPGRVERVMRWGRRHQWQAAAVACGLLAIVLVAVLAITRTIAAERERSLRSQAEGLARQEQASRIRAEGLARREEEHRRHAEQLLRLAEARQAALQYQLATRALDEQDFGTALKGLLRFPGSQRSLETRLLERKLQARPQTRATLIDDYWGIVAAAPSPDAKRLVTSYATGTVLVWDLTTGRVTARLSEGRWSQDLRRRWHYFEDRPKDSKMADWGPCYTGLTWLAGSERVGAVSLDGTAAVFDLRTNTAKTIKRVAEPLYAVCSSSDGSQVVCGGSSGKLYAASLATDTDTSPVEGESAITAILALPESKHYLVGRADGTLELRFTEDLSSQAKWIASGSIWGLDAKAVEDGWLVAVACEAPEIAVLHVPRKGPAIEPNAMLKPPRTTERALVYHAVQFAAAADRVRAVGSSGCLTQWDLKTKEVDWSVAVLGRDPRRALQSLEQRLPPPLRRVGSLILERSAGELSGGQAQESGQREGRPAVGGVGEVGRPAPSAERLATNAGGGPSDGGQLVVAGDDGVIHLLDVSRVREANGTILKATVGKRPRIRFDAEHPEWLWTLDQDGLLSVVDCRADRCLVSRKAHDGQSPDLTVVDSVKVIATVGGDNLMQFWRCQDGRIESARKAIRHDEALLSVAASPDGRWVAGVDATARLSVWDYATGKQVFLTPLGVEGASTAGPSQERPLTGRLAFTANGSRLAAFGAGQTACVFETSPFRRLAEQIWIAGTGGTAMIWSPTDPGLLIAGDDFPRFVVRAFSDAAEAKPNLPYNPDSTCVALANTPDGRRVVALEERGTVHFFEAEHLISLLKLSSTFSQVTHLAIDPQGQRLAVAAADGSIEIWNASSDTDEADVKIADSVDRWTSSPLIEPTAHVIRTEPRMVQMNARGQVGALYVESKPGDFRIEGALHFVDESGGDAGRERVEVGDAAYARRASPDSAAFLFAPDGQPVAVFRLRTAVSSPYDGAIYLARRQNRDQWTFETVHEHGNMGFYPLMRLDGAGRPAELFHFRFGGFDLVRSTPDDAGGLWSAQAVGQQGDGADLGGSWSADGVLHLLFRVNRFNSDPRHVIYARWDGRELQRQVVDPFQSISLPQVEFAPDGAPVVLVGKRLMRLTPSGWAEYATLPPLPVESFAINSAGDVYLVSWDGQNERVVLGEGREDSWYAQAIAQFTDYAPPNFCTLRLGPHGEPVVVVGCVNQPYGWVRVLRRKE